MLRELSKKNIISYLFFGLAVILIFFSTFVYQFGAEDDYSFFIHGSRWYLHPETFHVFAIGRWMGGFLLNIQYFFIKEISDLTILRVVSVLLLICGGIGISKILRQVTTLSFSSSLMIPFFLVFTKAFVSGVLDQMQMTLNIVNLFAILAAVKMFEEGHSYYKKVSISTVSKEQKNLIFRKYLYGMGFIFISFSIYQPFTPFVFFFTLSRLLFNKMSDWREIRRKTAIEVVLFCVTGLVYFLLHRCVGIYVLSLTGFPIEGYINQESASHYKFIFTFEFKDKLTSLGMTLDKVIQLYYYKSVQLHSYYPYLLYIVYSLPFLAGLIILWDDYKAEEKGILFYRFQVLILSIFICLMSLFVVLIAPASVNLDARSFAPPMSSFLIILVCSVLGLFKSFKMNYFSRIIISLFFIILCVYPNFKYIKEKSLLYSKPLYRTKAVFKKYYSEENSQKYRGICFLVPFSQGGSVGFVTQGLIRVLNLEYGVTSPPQNMLVSEMDFQAGTAYISRRCLLAFENQTKDVFDIIKSHSYQKRIKNTYLLDTSDDKAQYLIEFFDPMRTTPLTIYQAHYPFWVEIEPYEKRYSLRSYELQSYFAQIGRMVKKWKLIGSHDRLKWTVLDEQDVSNKAFSKDRRAYSVLSTNKYRYYRVVFLDGPKGVVEIGDIDFNFEK